MFDLKIKPALQLTRSKYPVIMITYEYILVKIYSGLSHYDLEIF